jgi:hypothetical protein
VTLNCPMERLPDYLWLFLRRPPDVPALPRSRIFSVCHGGAPFFVSVAFVEALHGPFRPVPWMASRAWLRQKVWACRWLKKTAEAGTK